MRYTITWYDFNSTDNYKSEADFIKQYKDHGVKVIDIEMEIKDWENEIGGWVDSLCTHEFEAKNDKEAIKYVKNYDFLGRDIQVFSLQGVDTDFIYTEEDLGE